MKILYLSNIPVPYQLDLFYEINKLDNITFKYVCLYKSFPHRKWKLDTKDINILNYKKFSIRSYIDFWRLLKKENPDFILVSGYKLELSNIAILYSKIYKKKLLFWLEKPNITRGIKKLIRNVYISFRLKFADKIIVIGRKAEKFYKVYHNKTYNLPYSMNLEKFYNIKRTTDNIDKIRFLYTGQFVSRKNIINLIDAFKELEDNNIELWLVGDGKLKEKVINLAKNDYRIRIIPFVQPNNLFKIYEKCNVYIIPSKDDGWALVINEAMASAMPIIGSSRVGAVNEYIKHKKNGYIVDLDKSSIKKGFEYYINKKNLIIKHGLLNRDIIKKSNADVKNAAKYMINILVG